MLLDSIASPFAIVDIVSNRPVYSMQHTSLKIFVAGPRQESRTLTPPQRAFLLHFFIADQATFLGQQPYSNRIHDDLRRNFSAAIFL